MLVFLEIVFVLCAIIVVIIAAKLVINFDKRFTKSERDIKLQRELNLINYDILTCHQDSLTALEELIEWYEDKLLSLASSVAVFLDVYPDEDEEITTDIDKSVDIIFDEE